MLMMMMLVVVLGLSVQSLNLAPRMATWGIIIVLKLEVVAQTALHIELTGIHGVVRNSDTARRRLTLQLSFIRFLTMAL